MKPARLILLFVAVLAAGLAAYLVMGMTRAPSTSTVVTEVVQEAKTQILVATTAVGMGERLSPDKVQWQDWPEGAIRPEYVTISAMPEAPEQLTGAVARFEFFPGEPIREAKLVRADQGYLSAVLQQGMRGVSVGVQAESSAGGFIVPNDHVDVVLTTQVDGTQQSRVVTSNVRVLAIGGRLGEMGVSGGNTDSADAPQPVVFDADTIATLEVTPGQGETIINAASQGQLSLALRSVVDFRASAAADNSSSQSVRLIRFGREQSINAGTVNQPVMPTAQYEASTAIGATVAVEPQVMPQ